MDLSDLTETLQSLRRLRGQLVTAEKRLESLGEASISELWDETPEALESLSTGITILDATINDLLDDISTMKDEEGTDEIVLDEPDVWGGDPEEDLCHFHPKSIAAKALKAAIYRATDRVSRANQRVVRVEERMDDLETIQKSISQELEGVKSFLRREKGFK